MSNAQHHHRPSFAFIAASWCAMCAGVVAYLVGLWNATMQLNEKGYYFAVLVLTLFAAISVQKSVRDRLEGIPVTGLYYGIAWAALLTGVLLLCAGLFNATFMLSEKGFYGMSFALSAFGAIAVQKNTRDVESAKSPVSGATAVQKNTWDVESAKSPVSQEDISMEARARDAA